MAYGTDSFFYVPGETRGTIALMYLDSYTEANIPAPYVLKMMTTNAARLLGVESRARRSARGARRRHHRHARRPARGHHGAAPRRLRDEGRQGHTQALTRTKRKLRRFRERAGTRARVYSPCNRDSRGPEGGIRMAEGERGRRHRRRERRVRGAERGRQAQALEPAQGSRRAGGARLRGRHHSWTPASSTT
jgi:hypothetical protein